MKRNFQPREAVEIQYKYPTRVGSRESDTEIGRILLNKSVEEVGRVGERKKNYIDDLTSVYTCSNMLYSLLPVSYTHLISTNYI